MPKYRYLMFTNAAEGRDAEFNDWYDNVHIPDILASGGLKSPERYEIVASAFTPPSEHRYAAIYEVDGDDPDQALQKLVDAFSAGKMRMSDSLDMQTGRPILLKALG